VYGSIGKPEQFKVVVALLDAAAHAVPAIGNARIADLRPGCTAVEALPDSLINRVATRIELNKPRIHFIASRNDCDLSAVDRASATVRRGLSRAGRGAESSTSRLVGESSPTTPVRRGVKTVKAD